MGSRQNNRPYKKRNNQRNNYKSHPRNISDNETNVAEQNSVSHEFQSFRSSHSYSNYYFGFDIFDMYSPEELFALIRDPMTHNRQCREISLVLYSTNGVYTNTVDYLTAMPTLDRVVVPHGESKKKRDKNKRLMESTLRKIKDKEYIRDALFCGMVEGTTFGYFETTTRPYSNRKTMTDIEVD